jgi:CBS domain-containing protein
MTREIVTLAPDETVGTALALCRERRIRHLPVLTEGRLVGIVSDRDLRSATPAFGDQERAAALQEILVEDVMASAEYRDLRTPSVAEGDPAPDFELPTLDGGETVRLASLLERRPVALVFGSYT